VTTDARPLLHGRINKYSLDTLSTLATRVGTTRGRKSGNLKIDGSIDEPYDVTTGETSMRSPLRPAAAAVVIAALFSEAPTAPAQSAGSYPFCAIYAAKGGTPMCYFATREQCMADISGLGGLCVQNSSYRPIAASAPPRRQRGRTHQ
jgi:hypothetical protein